MTIRNCASRWQSASNCSCTNSAAPRFDGEKLVKEERVIKGEVGRIRDVRVGPDGYIYLLTDESNGVIARLEPAQ